MRIIILNGEEMKDKASTHAYLKEKLGFPGFYGGNLDALWDLLSTDFTPKKIIVTEPETVIENLGSFGEKLLNVFQDAAAANGFIDFEMLSRGEVERHESLVELREYFTDHQGTGILSTADGEGEVDED